MELGKIKARIREKGCKPSIPMVLPGSNTIVWVNVEKASLMAELDKLFPTKVSETGLMFDGEKLMPVKMASAAAKPPADPIQEVDLLADSPAAGAADDDDLLADSPAAGAPVDDDEDLLA